MELQHIPMSGTVYLKSAIECALIQQHSLAGDEVLKEIEFPWPIAQLVLQHRECVDGSGYPNGLKDAEILPEAGKLVTPDASVRETRLQCN